MSQDEIMSLGAFNAVMYPSDVNSREEDSYLLQTVLESQNDPNDLSFFVTSRSNVTDKTMTEQTDLASLYLKGKPNNPIFPVKITNENEVNAYLNGIISPTTFAFFSKVNPITAKTQSKVNDFVDLVMDATKQKHAYTARTCAKSFKIC